MTQGCDNPMEFIYKSLFRLSNLMPGIFFVLFFLGISALPAFAGSVELPRTGQTNCYDAAGAVIPCAGTGQDGEYQAGVPWPVPRFTDNGDGTVTDLLTGLMWTTNANVAGSVYWPDALSYVAGMNAGTNPNFGYTDWHLPNINELYSLADADHASPILPPGTPFINMGTGTTYWSSTTGNFAAGYEGTAWTLNMRGGDISSSSKIAPLGYPFRVWPVRDSGTPGPAQVPSTGQVTCYDANGAIIPCAGTGQDGDIKAGVPWPVARFTDHGDGTVTDNLTGLMWLKDATPLPTNPSGWQDSIDYIARMNAGVYPNSGYTDWRLSNRRELNSLKKYEGPTASPTLSPYYAPFYGPDIYTFYWTSTTAAGAPLYNNRSLWRMYWYFGQEFQSGCKCSGDVGRQMWPVRGGQVLSLNQSPVANAGMGQTVHIGSPVTLDGSASYDPDGNAPLTYSWSLAVPSGSGAVLDDPSVVMPGFTTDIIGDYTATLVVTDSLGAASDPADVTISTSNTKPVADAGPDQAISTVGQTVQLDGTQSFDDDGDNFTYLWQITGKPATSAAGLDDPTLPTPSFTADVHDATPYTIELTVTDEFGAASNPDTVVVSFDNVAPVADAGNNQSVVAGDTVYLDGSGSSDANLDPLTYSWSIASKPAGSGASLTDPTAVNPSFVADVAGTYVVSLVVNDGFVDSPASNVTVQAITAQDAASQKLMMLIDLINSLSDNDFKNHNMKNALTNKINAVLGQIQNGQYQEALDKLQNDILGKTDGCAATGSPDPNDWITDCTSQDVVYPLIIEAINLLSGLV